MKPFATYYGPPALGLRGEKKGQPIPSANTVKLKAGEEYQPFEVPDERRAGVLILGISPNGNPRRKPDDAPFFLSNRAGSMTGLFPLGSDYPGCYVGGYPKEGPEKDQDAILVKWTPEEITAHVFPSFGHSKTVLVDDWREGNLEGVEPPK